MLTSLMLIPMVASAIILFLSNNQYMKQLALAASLIVFWLSLVVWRDFDPNMPEGSYEFTQSFLTGSIGIDGISLYFILLTTLITPICLLSNWDNVPDHSEPYFLICFLVLESLLIAVFIVLDLLLFYIFFESVLIPLFFIVGIWGSGHMRIRAAYLLFLYTLFGSLFMLLSFLVIYYNVGSTDFQVISMTEIDLSWQKLLWVGVFMSMAIKTPLVPFNTWLTYAHSEAPVGGSIILAGVILKLATYGYLRIMLQFLPDATDFYSPIVQVFAVISIIYASLSTLRQTDFKKLVAYSSVAHAATIVLGLFSNNVQGLEGAVVLGVAHGLVSPALFFLVGAVLYDRFHTRTIRYYRGVAVYMPLFSLFFFLFSIFNAAVPISANWIGEFMSLAGMFQRSPIIVVLASTTIVLSAAYSIWLFNRICFGTWSPYLEFINIREYQYTQVAHDMSRREYMVLLPLLILSVVVGVYPNFILHDIHNAVAALTYITLPINIQYL